MSTGWFISPVVIVFIFPVTCLFFSVTFPLLLAVITLSFLLLSDVTLFPFNKFKSIFGCGIILGCCVEFRLVYS